MSDKLDELDRKKAEPEIELKVDDAQIRGAVGHIADVAEDEGNRRSGGFFRSLFTPNRGIIMALRTGIPAVLGSPIGAAAVVLGGVFAASFAAAVISSGAFAAIGAGLTGLAAVALRENERLKASFASLGQVAQTELTSAASSLVPVFDSALNTVQRMFGSHIADPLERIFAGLGPTIVPFVETAVRTVGDVLDTLGTPEFLSAMQTVMGAITENMPRFGAAFSEALLEIASNADDIAEAFGNVTSVMTGLIGFGADAINVFNDLFNEISSTFGLLGKIVGPPLEKAIGFLQEVDRQVGRAGGEGNRMAPEPKELLGMIADSFMEGRVFSGTVERMEQYQRKAAGMAKVTGRVTHEASLLARTEERLRTQVEQTTEALDAERSRLQRLTDTMFAGAEQVLSLRDAQVAYQEQVDVTSETLARNGETLNINTEKGRENRESIDAMAEAALRQIEAMIVQGKSTEQVTDFTRKAREQFVRAAIDAGMEAEAARRLADKLGLIPSEVRTKAELIDNATRKIQNLEEKLDQLENDVRHVEIDIHQDFFTTGRIHFPGAGGSIHTGGKITPTGIERFHQGGAVLGPDERMIIAQTGERVLSRRQTAAFGEFMQSMRRPVGAQPAPSGGHGGGTTIQLVNHGVIGSQHEMDRWLAEAVNRLRRVGRLN